jgi:ankyrin repeat protein
MIKMKLSFGILFKFRHTNVMVKEYVAIIECTKRGMYWKVAELLKFGADPNKRNRYGERAIIVAAKRDDMKILQMLVDGGASVKDYDHNGMTALAYARFNGNSDMEQFILDRLMGPFDLKEPEEHCSHR